MTIPLPTRDAGPAKPPMPNPTEDDVNSPTFLAIWEVIKSWDVNVPEHYRGYMGANGSHVKLILDAMNEVETVSENKHDGDLGNGYTVAMHYSDVEISDGRAEFVALTPAQALKLLAWLEEEYPNLWRLTREDKA